MLLRVDPALPLPVYEQIRSQVARLVASGQLVAGARLPTIRQLAADLGLAKGTVERAYVMLESDGVVASRGRAGTVVVGSPPSGSAAAGAGDDLRDAADAMAVTVRQLGVTDQAALSALGAALARLG